MKERPIIFSDPMVRAIQEGRKTQTRRVIKPQPDILSILDEYGLPGTALGYNRIGVGTTLMKCPYGQPGDLLWVRETWSPWADELTRQAISRKGEPCLYKADYLEKAPCVVIGGDFHWHPSIHMPKKYARLWLRITNVRVERLQEISIKDCKAEGVLCDCPENEENRCLLGNKGHFKILWDSLNAKRGYSWESNPWVWVVEFERYEKTDN